MNEEPSIDDRRALDDTRAEAANSGDSAAAGAYLADNLPQLTSMARWIANGVIDHEDLASEAITALLGVWSQGTGPTSNPNSYVARSMRNRVIDEYRSPRSRVQSVIDAERELRPHLDSTRSADLHREYGYVNEALRSLPADQRLALTAVVVDGRKPAELEKELDRPASAIYSLLRRAKVSLRRATLRVVLDEDAPEECRRAANRLPENVTLSVDDAPDSGGMSHIRSCERCRAAWARFGAMSTLLGLLPLLVVGNVLTPSAPASADDRRPSRTNVARVAAAGLRAGWGTRVLRALAVTSIVAGAVLVVSSIPVVQQLFAVDDDRPLQFGVTSQALPGDRAQIDVALRLEGTESVAVDLRLPEGTAVISVPDGWDCGVSTTRLACTTRGGSDGRFLLDDARADEDGDYRLTLTAWRGEREVTGVARGGLRTEEQTVTANLR